MKAFINLRPRQHKCAPNWSVDEVLALLHSWEDNNMLTLKKLTKKLVMLLALSSSSRCSEIANINANGKRYIPGGIQFPLLKHKKNRKASVLPGTVFFPHIKDKKLCPATCLEYYLSKTGSINRSDGALIRTTIKPHKAATSMTISRWLTEIICSSGQQFPTKYIRRGHTTRGQAATKAKKLGLTSEQILNAGEWKSENVFTKHYLFKHQPEFGRTVLEYKSQ